MPESDKILVLRRVKASFGDNPTAKSKLVKLLAAPSCNAAIIETLALFADDEDEEDFKVAALAILTDNEEGNDSNGKEDMVNEAQIETPLLPWQDEVVKILRTGAFKEDEETFLRVRWFLHNADLEFREKNPSEPHSPYWKSLRGSMYNPVHFTDFAQRLAEDTKTAEMNPQFKQAMEDAYNGMMQENGSSSQLVVYHGGSFQNAVASSKICLEAVAVSNSYAVDKIAAALGANANAIADVALAGGYLAAKSLDAIHHWWTGELSEQACAQICIDETATVAAGAFGSIGGAALGGAVMGGPGAAAVGSLVGGLTCLVSGSYLSDWMTQNMFYLPKEEALENAYSMLGISPDSSNSKVNQGFYKLCLKHHPDKGGDKDEFIKVQTAMEVIRASREELC